MNFYHALYPMEEDPMFYIHLNVDYPFTLTGILYFPKIKERMAIDKNKIQLYCNQMFVTEHVDNIVPDFLTAIPSVLAVIEIVPAFAVLLELLVKCIEI